MKAGIGKSWAIVALNCLLLGIGCWASYFVLRQSFGYSTGTAEFICLLTLLSFVTVRNVTYPLSDISFLGASMPCLLLLRQAEAEPGLRRYWRLALAAPLIGFCIELRTIGVALIPAFAWAMLGGMASAARIPEWVRRREITSLVPLIVVLITIAGTSWIFLHSPYLQFSAKILHRRGILGNFVSDLGDHTLEWGEMVVNAPSSRLPRVLLFPLRIAGFFTFTLWAIGIWVKRRM